MKTPASERPSVTDAGSTHDLLRLADQCVKCGLCLPHCPTFQKARNEADSPRGRIALIQGWATGHLEMTRTLEGHLDGCLGCRNCERVCPSGVAYGQIADMAKALRVKGLPAWRRRLTSAGLRALSDARCVAQAARLSRLYLGLGLARLAEVIGVARIAAVRPYHRLATAMGAAARRVGARDPNHADVDLFVGCMGCAGSGHAIEATRVVATRLGLEIRISPDPTCCGALLRHNGYPAEADTRLRACTRTHGSRPLAGLASACVAELREEPALADTTELCAFLNRIHWPERLEISPLHGRVLIHEPCSHRNRLGGNAAVHRLLARIPGLDLAPLPPGQGCCGAAGTYLLQQPAMAETLLGDLLAPLRADPPDVLVTTNPGCALHLAAGIREAGLDIEVCHPVELLARALDSSEAAADSPEVQRRRLQREPLARRGRILDTDGQPM